MLKKFDEGLQKALNHYEVLLHTVTNILIGLSMFLRTGGAGYQYVTGKLKRLCFDVDDGALVQTPFTYGCMREIDYPILVLTVIAMFFCILTINFILLNNIFSKIKTAIFSLTQKYLTEIV